MAGSNEFSVFLFFVLNLFVNFNFQLNIQFNELILNVLIKLFN